MKKHKRADKNTNDDGIPAHKKKTVRGDIKILYRADPTKIKGFGKEWHTMRYYKDIEVAKAALKLQRSKPTFFEYKIVEG